MCLEKVPACQGFVANNVPQLPEGRDFYHKTWFEKLMFD